MTKFRECGLCTDEKPCNFAGCPDDLREQEEEKEPLRIDLLSINSRVKNIASDWDAHLTPMGTALCNAYSIVLKDLYDFADNLPETHRQELIDLLQSKENFPRYIIEVGKKNSPKKVPNE